MELQAFILFDGRGSWRHEICRHRQYRSSGHAKYVYKVEMKLTEETGMEKDSAYEGGNAPNEIITEFGLDAKQVENNDSDYIIINRKEVA